MGLMNYRIEDIFSKLASFWYTPKRLEHAHRVAMSVTNDPLLSTYYKDSLYVVGLLHDIIEHTDLTFEQLQKEPHLRPEELEAIKVLTRNKKECSRETYMKNISESINPYVKPVKRADIKDHLLYDNVPIKKLEKKYFPVLKYVI